MKNHTTHSILESVGDSLVEAFMYGGDLATSWDLLKSFLPCLPQFG